MRIVTALVALAAPLAPLVAIPAAHAATCPDVELIFARGTSEPAGAGRVGQALADQLAALLGGRSLGVYGVNYPATYDFLAAADGAADADAEDAADAPGGAPSTGSRRDAGPRVPT